MQQQMIMAGQMGQVGMPGLGQPAVSSDAMFGGQVTEITLNDSRDPDAPPVSREPLLQRAMSVTSQVYRVTWTVDARKLKGSDREAVSPPFELSFTKEVQFKMVIRPKTVNDG